MELTLVLRSGDEAGKHILVPTGSTRRVGRQFPAEVRVADDPLLSNQHFSIESDGELWVLRDLGSKYGTTVNGQKIYEAILRDGDEIQAGRTIFCVRLEDDVRATPAHPSDPGLQIPPVAVSTNTPLPGLAETSAVLGPRQQGVLDHLRKLDGLFALLDAAREPTVVPRLESSGEKHASLYNDDEGEQLAPFGPWLVQLPVGRPLVESLVRDGWGQSWGVYLTCCRPFEELRRHLRQFLTVRLPDARLVCFRYYDPRVLRTYLPTCTTEELVQFVGPIERYIVESADEDELLEFSANYRDWRKVRLRT